MEVDIKEVGHILCIGDRSDIRSLRDDLEGYTEKEAFVPFARLLEFVSRYEMLVIGAHPFRPSTPLKDLHSALLIQLDAFDLNGKDLHTRGIEKTKRMSIHLRWILVNQLLVEVTRIILNSLVPFIRSLKKHVQRSRN